jgi:hypothetical protein
MIVRSAPEALIRLSGDQTYRCDANPHSMSALQQQATHFEMVYKDYVLEAEITAIDGKWLTIVSDGVFLSDNKAIVVLESVSDTETRIRNNGAIKYYMTAHGGVTDNITSPVTVFSIEMIKKQHNKVHIRTHEGEYVAKNRKNIEFVTNGASSMTIFNISMVYRLAP